MDTREKTAPYWPQALVAFVSLSFLGWTHLLPTASSPCPPAWHMPLCVCACVCACEHYVHAGCEPGGSSRQGPLSAQAEFCHSNKQPWLEA